MANVFEFQAPQFVDFNSGLDDSDDADKFFDVEQETPPKNDDKENRAKNIIEEKSASTGKQLNKSSEGYSANVHAISKTPLHDEGTHNSNKKRRDMIKAVRRLSDIKTTGQTSLENQKSEENLIDEENLSLNLSNVSLKPRKRTHFEGIEIKIENEKQHTMTTRNDEKIKTPKIELRSRSVTKDDDPKANLKRKRAFGEENKAPEKYMALAEHILHFQKDTPPRFHSHRRQSTGITGNLLKKRQSYKPRRTIALTPKLMTSMRSRPVEAPSQKEREDLELEEIKRHQIKANPLNEKIFLPPKLPPKHEKSKIAPAPFNLTQVVKKPQQEVGEEPYKFTANPVPKAILEKPVGIAPKKEIPLTVPESPAITKPAWAYKRVRVAAVANDFQNNTEDVTAFGVPLPKTALRRNTEVKPFSFEVRDKQMQEKKEKKLKDIMEAEKKMREFKANPIPTFVASKDTTRSSMRYSHLNCSKASIRSVSECEEPPKTFKARSPRVLRKNPFKPVTEHTHSEPLDIQLHTDRRAAERREFEMKQAEKEDRLEGLKLMMEIRKKEAEEAELARLRKETVHKAQPMPKFKPVPLNEKVVSHQPLTNPQSPRFSKRTRTTAPCSSNLIQK